MPRKRKAKDNPISERHIRRLARQRMEEDLRDIDTFSTSSQDNDSENEAVSTTLSMEIKNSAVVENKNISPESAVEGTVSEQSSMQSKNLQPQIQSGTQSPIINVAPHICYIDSNYTHESDNSDIQELNADASVLHHSDGENSNDLDDESGISEDDVYRYSDSDAESIPDIESNDGKDVSDFFNLVTKDDKFRKEIAEWAIHFEIKHNAITALLIILNKYTDTVFPKDSRTLLKTPRVTNIVNMENGQYCHLGVKNFVQTVIECRILLKHKFDSVNLSVNIDGAPITGRSNEKGLWLILLKDLLLNIVHLSGVYYGEHKPQDQNNLLRSFVEEAKQLINDGFLHNSKMYKVFIKIINCDAPAKSYVLCTKYPSGYFSCSKCVIEGDYENCVCFPVKTFKSLSKLCNDLLRSDNDFQNLKYLGDYQRGSTILNELPKVGLVSNVTLDCMHLVYLGVMKQLIRHWIGNKGRRSKMYKLSAEQIALVSERLENLKYVLPFEFNRRSRSLQYYKIWKATEFRHFLLYFGPVVLKDILQSKVYKHFLKLHTAIVILSNKVLIRNIENSKFAENLLLHFVYDFQKIYGRENVTYNVHNLIHLSKDVQKFGPLDFYSAFPFENYICSLKKLIRKGEKPLQQLARRIGEYELVNNFKKCLDNNDIRFEKQYYNGMLTTDRQYESQFKMLITPSCKIDISDDRNNCVILKNGSIVNILNIAKSNDIVYIIGKKLENKNQLFTTDSLPSDSLGIKIVKESENCIKSWSVDCINAKVFKIPCAGNVYVTNPLIHTFETFEK